MSSYHAGPAGVKSAKRRRKLAPLGLKVARIAVGVTAAGLRVAMPVYQPDSYAIRDGRGGYVRSDRDPHELLLFMTAVEARHHLREMGGARPEGAAVERLTADGVTRLRALLLQAGTRQERDTGPRRPFFPQSGPGGPSPAGDLRPGAAGRDL